MGEILVILSVPAAIAAMAIVFVIAVSTIGDVEMQAGSDGAPEAQV